MSHTAKTLLTTLGMALCLPLCRPGRCEDLSVPPPKAASPAEPKLTATICWKASLFDFDPVTGGLTIEPPGYLEVTILAQGGHVAEVTAYGNVVVDSLKNEEGKIIPVQSPEEGVDPLEPGFPEGADPQNTVAVAIPLRDLPPVRKISELRGSFVWETGGQWETIPLPDALKATNRPIEHNRLASLGLTVRVRRPQWPQPAKVAPKMPLSTPGGLDFVDEVQCFLVNTADRRVRFKWTDARGTSLPGSSAEGGFNLVLGEETHTFRFKEKLPEGCQLRVLVYREGQPHRIPFVFTDLEVPPEYSREEALQNVGVSAFRHPWARARVPRVSKPTFHTEACPSAPLPEHDEDPAE